MGLHLCRSMTVFKSHPLLLVVLCEIVLYEIVPESMVQPLDNRFEEHFYVVLSILRLKASVFNKKSTFPSILLNLMIFFMLFNQN